MKYRILCVGKLKEAAYKNACDEFCKRLTRYGEVEIVEVADEKAPERLSCAQREQVKDAEGARLLARLEAGEYAIAMDLGGVDKSSEELAAFLQARMNEGKSRIAFLVGGSLGLSDALLRRAELRLRFGPNTFSHQIFRLMLLEQLYRCCKINSGEPYHK